MGSLWPVGAEAHHSIASIYDMSRSVTIVGTVRSFELTSPHSRLTIAVTEGVHTYVWQVELPSVTFLARAGWSEHSLTCGEQVRLTGAPARYSADQLYVTDIAKADGNHLQLVPTVR